MILPCALIHLGKKLYTNTQYFGLSSMFIFSYHMVLKYPDICTCILPISSKFLREKWKLNNGFHSLQGTKQCVDVCQKLYPVLQQAVAKAVEDRLSSDHVTWPINSIFIIFNFMISHIQSLFSDIHYSKNFDRIWCSCIPWYILLINTEQSLYLVNAICDIWHCCIEIYVVSFCDWNKHVNEKFWFNILKLNILKLTLCITFHEKYLLTFKF